MKMSSHYKYILCLLVLVCQLPAWATLSETKSQSATFKLSRDGKVRLVNKYGDITFNTWKKDSVKIEVDITVEGKEVEKMEKDLANIEAELKQLGDMVEAITYFQTEKSSAFKKLFKDVSVFDKTKVSVDYTVYLHEDIEIEVESKFGDIVLQNHSDEVSIDMSYGSISCNELNGQINLDLKHSRGRIGTVADGKIYLKHSTMDLEEAGQLKIESTGSNYEIEKCEELKLESGKDNVELEEIGTLDAICKFSSLEIKSLETKASIESRLGSIEIDNVNPAIEYLKLDCSSGDIDINIKGISAKIEGHLESGNMKIPSSATDINTKVLDEKTNLREVSAKYGSQAVTAIEVKSKNANILFYD